MKSCLKRWLKHKGLVLVLLLLVLLRVPSLFEPPWYGDESIYLTIGQGIRKGLVLYRDITDYPNKPPLIYLLAGVAGNVFWFRFILLGWQLIQAVIVYCLFKTWWPKRKALANIFTLIFVGLTSLPALEGNIANGEMFMIMPATAGMLLLWRAKQKVRSKKGKRQFLAYLGAGGLFSLGILFKIPVVLDMMAAILFFWVFREDWGLGKALVKTVADKRWWIWLIGLMGPILIIIAIWWLQGVAPIYLLKNMMGSAGYVSAWRGARAERLFDPYNLMFRGLVLLVMVSGLYGWRKKLDKKVLFGGLWLVLALFGALLSGRPYPHYLLQIVVPLLVLLAAIIAEGIALSHLVVGGGLILILGVVYLKFGFSLYPTLRYYSNFAGFISGGRSFDEYVDGFDARMARNFRVARWLKERTTPEERIYIWGTEPDIYVMADRLPVGKLTVSFHVEDLRAYKETAALLERELPKFIVVMQTEWREFPELKRLLERRYTLVEMIEEAEIYHLPPPPRGK